MSSNGRMRARPGWGSRPGAPPLSEWAASRRSPRTALAVGRPPAPRPKNISSPTALPSTKTALKLSWTLASGWERGTSDGCTRAETDPSSCCSTTASSLMAKPIRRAKAKSPGVSPLMPSRATSPATSFWPKATVAMIAALAAASKPSTSAVGSRSAKPRDWASASASP